ncbi:MAG: deoxyribodipyrimidine photolyase [Vicinamibacterales bacterium]
MSLSTEPTLDVSPTHLRVRQVNAGGIRADGDYVLYWMIAARRAQWNFALDRAVAHAHHLHKPLVVLEALAVDYPWASDRLHRFVIEGMGANAAALAGSPVLYYPYVEPHPQAGRGLVAALAARACVVVTDEFPCFFLPRVVAVAGHQVDVRLEAVDGNGLIPLRAADRAFSGASHFRRFAQRVLPTHLASRPREHPFEAARLPRLRSMTNDITVRWPAASDALLAGDDQALAALPIDHEVPVVAMRGGSRAGRKALEVFVTTRLARYAAFHNEPEANVTSQLSPYLHFGHLSAHEVLATVMRGERWSLRRLRDGRATGAREGWWGVSQSVEAFLDQLVTWRELGYNMCALRPDDYDRYESLPDWAQTTLEQHRRDRRSHVYARAALEGAHTHDPLWNAAQGQLLREGWFHNYMRLIWGKKILEWSTTPREALDSMVAIMNRWSLDGRNPNSYSGYFWTLGRYDRPWPERPVFGKVRAMSTKNTARKVAVARYIQAYAPS